MCLSRQRLDLLWTRLGRLALLVALSATAARAGGKGATGLDLNGQPVDPFEASHGKLVVLLFVRTDCPIANRYAPEIQRLSAAHADTTRFWLVYPDKSESPEQIRAHDKDYGYAISALRDPKHALVKLAGATITPEAALFEGDGRLIYHGRIDNWFVEMGRARSAPTRHDLENAILAAVKNPAASVAATQAIGCYISDLN